MYTIKKGAYYVRDMKKGGGTSSYTLDSEYAVRYETKEEALKNCCGNETVVKMTMDWK